MWRQRRGGIDRSRRADAGSRCGAPADAAGSAGRPGISPLLVEVFGIAHDGVIDARHVGAQLMGAPGDRLQRHPGELLRRRFDHGVISHRVARALVAVTRRSRITEIVLALFLGKERRDAPCFGFGTPATSAQ